MNKSRLLTGLISVYFVSSVLLASFANCGAQVYPPPSAKQAAAPVSFPTERWQAKCNHPPGTLGQPVWKSVTVVDGIVYAHAYESYNEEHGNNHYEYDTIYAWNASTGSKVWVFTDTEGLGDPTIVDGVLYTEDGSNFYAIDAMIGAQKWNYSVEGGIAWYLPPTDGVICFGVENTPSSDSKCYVSAVNQATGEEVWRHEFGYNYNFVEPAVGDGALYFGADDRYYAYDLNNGNQRLDVKIGNLTGGNLEGFYFEKQAPYANGKIYMTTGNIVYAISAQNGGKVWSFSSNGYSFVNPSYTAGGHVYAIGYQAMYTRPNAYALDAATGKQLWNYSINGYWKLDIASVNYGIVILTWGSTFCGLNATNGLEVWNHYSSGVIYSYDPINYVLEAWNPMNGTVIWSFKLNPTTIDNVYGIYYSYFLGEADNIAYFSAYDRFFAVNIPSVNLPTPLSPSPTAEASTPIPTEEIPTSETPNLESLIVSQYPMVTSVIVAIVVLAAVVMLRKKVSRKSTRTKPL